jgi:hypothetical protein
MADIRERKKAAKEKKRGFLLTFGDKTFEFLHRHAVVVTVAAAAIIVGVFIIFLMRHNAQAAAQKASYDLQTCIEEMYSAPNADATTIAADKVEKLREDNKGDKKFYPWIVFRYAQACRELGIKFDNVELLERAIKAYDDLLQNYPSAPITQLQGFITKDGKQTQVNLVTAGRDYAARAKADIQSKKFAEVTGGKGLPESERKGLGLPSFGGPAPEESPG